MTILQLRDRLDALIANGVDLYMEVWVEHDTNCNEFGYGTSYKSSQVNIENEGNLSSGKKILKIY